MSKETSAPEKRDVISVTLPKQLIKDLDAWRSEIFGQPNRSAVIEDILKDFLENQKKSA